MAHDDLGIEDAKNAVKHPFAACHRLAQDDNASVIIKFGNLASKNEWLARAGKLKNTNLKITQDLPQSFKDLCDELLLHRKKLDCSSREHRRCVSTGQYFQAVGRICRTV
jgi:hypothetical protein